MAKMYVYKCDLCKGQFGTGDYADIEGFGIKWGHMSFIKKEDSQYHLCERCIKGVVRAADSGKELHGHS